MVLPERCPQDNELQCKGKECHLFHVDWRTGEENCTIGYRSTHRQDNKSERVLDTYAEDTRMLLGNRPAPKPAPQWPSERKPIRPDLRDEREQAEPLNINPVEEAVIRKPEIQERIVMETEYTTVIHSQEATLEEQEAEVITGTPEKDSAAKGRLDKMMKLDDLPEDYEKEFWN